MIIEYEIQKPVREVYSYLSDMQKFAKMHPVIYKIEQLTAREYLFHEKIKILYIPFRFSYKVELRELKENTSVYMYSRVQAGVHLDLRFELTENTSGTEVRELIAIRAFPVAKQVFASILRKAHAQFFENIRKL